MSNIQHISSYVRQAAENTAARTEYFGEHGSLRTGIQSLDAKTKGMFDAGRLTVVAGGSGGGKTVFASQCAVEWASQVPVLWLTLEDDPVDAVNRVLANVSRTGVSDLRFGFSDGQMRSGVTDAAETIADLPIHVMHGHGTALALSGVVGDWSREHGRHDLPIRGAIIIDQLSHIAAPVAAERKQLDQLGLTAPAPSAPEHAILEFQVMVLREMAKKLGLAVLLLHQLNQQKADDGKLSQGSVRGSQGIVHKADAVLGITRSKTDDNPFDDGADAATPFSDFQCLKNRSGAGNWSVTLWFDGKHQRWADSSEFAETRTRAWTPQAPMGARANQFASRMQQIAASFDAVRAGTELARPATAPAISAAPVIDVEDSWDPDALSGPDAEEWS